MKFGVVVFPGSNCDDDAYHAIASVIGQPVEFIWHQSEQVSGFDAIMLPGGFRFRRLPAHGRDRAIFSRNEGGEPVRALGRAGARHLQRIPDSPRGGIAARRDAAQSAAAIFVPPSARARGKHRYAVHLRGASGTGVENADRAHGRKLFLRCGDVCGARGQPADRFSLRACGWARRGRG